MEVLNTVGPQVQIRVAQEITVVTVHSALLLEMLDGATEQTIGVMQPTGVDCCKKILMILFPQRKVKCTSC